MWLKSKNPHSNPFFLARRRLSGFFALFIYLVSTVSYAADERVWFLTDVKIPLSVVLSTLKFCPLYGSGRWIERVARENKKSLDRKGFVRYSGAKVFIPYDPSYFQENENVRLLSSGEIQFLAWTPKRCLDPTLASVSNLKRNPAAEESTLLPEPSPSAIPTPLLSPAPTPSPLVPLVQKLENEDSPEPESWFTIAAKSGYFAIKGKDQATGGSATVLSDITTGGVFAWSTRWNETWVSTAEFGLTRVQLLQPVGRAIDVSSTNLFDGNFGLAAKLNSRVVWHLDFGVEQSLGYRAISTTMLSLPKMTVPKAGTGFEFILARYKGLSLSLPVEVFYHFGAQASGITYSSGLNEAKSGLLLSHEKNGKRIEGGFYIRTEKEKSSAVEIQQTDIGLTFGYSWRLWD